jgi:hypothetical protein
VHSQIMSEMGPLRTGKKRRQVTAQINVTCTVMRVHLASRRMVTDSADILPRVGVSISLLLGRISLAVFR